MDTNAQQLQSTPAQTPVEPSKTNASPAPGGTSNKTKMMLVSVLAGFLVIGGSAAAYIQLVHNSPSKIWERALSSTATGWDKLIELSEREPALGTKIEGSLDISSPVAVSGSMSGQWYESNGSMTMDVGFSGVRMNAEVRTIAPDGSGTPDTYMKANGLEIFESLAGLADPDSAETLAALSEINDQWFVADRTLLDQFSALSGLDANTAAFNQDSVRELVNALTEVFKSTLLSTDEASRVFEVREEMGKEDFEGTDTHRFEIGVNPDNLKEFAAKFKEAAKGTLYEDVLTANGFIDYDDAFDLDDFNDEIDDSNLNEGFADVWVESSGRFIRNIRFYPEQDRNDANYVDIGIPYEGGDVIPFVVKMSIDESGSNGTMSFGFEVNQKSAGARIWADVDVRSAGLDVTGSGELNLTGSDEQVNVTKPESARNILELYSILFPGFSSTEDLLFDSLPSTETFPDLESINL